jgi:hypothetical protein
MLDADRRPWVRFVGPVLITLGGLLGAVGSWLNWFRIRRRLPGTPVEDVLSRGFANIDGKLTFVFAVIAVAAGVLILYFSTRRSYLWLGVVALIAGLWVAGLSTFDAATPRDRYVDAAAAVATEQGVPKEEAVTFFRQLVETGVVRINLQLGIYLVIAGGAGVILGSVASVLTRLTSQEEEPHPEEPEEYDYLSDEPESVYEAE